MKLVQLENIQPEPVSHNPEMTKRVFVRNGELRNLAFFSQSNIPAQSQTSSHAHQDMTEIFLVISGMGNAIIGDATHELVPGACLVINHNEMHSFDNTGSEPLVMNYFGIVDETVSNSSL